jgi:hypothetical protein
MSLLTRALFFCGLLRPCVFLTGGPEFDFGGNYHSRGCPVLAFFARAGNADARSDCFRARTREFCHRIVDVGNR